MSFSNYNENFLLNYLFTTKTVYVGYGTAATESTPTEPSGGGYARELFGDWTLTSVGDDLQQVTNDNLIEFDEATGAQGTITHVLFFDALTSGNFLGSVSFAELGLSNENVVAGVQLALEAGDCKCNLD